MGAAVLFLHLNVLFDYEALMKVMMVSFLLAFYLYLTSAVRLW